MMDTDQDTDVEKPVRTCAPEFFLGIGETPSGRLNLRTREGGIDTELRYAGFQVDDEIRITLSERGGERVAALPSVFTIWQFRDAPEELRALSDHGGDEDWLVWMPIQSSGGVPCAFDLEDGDYDSRFGSCGRYEHPYGDVLIFAHS